MKFLRAIYDKNVYQESLNEPFSTPLRYWISISLLSLLVISISLGLSIYKSLPSLEEITDTIPYFEINDGILSIEEGVELEGEPPIIIDDEFVYNADEFKYVPQYFIATKEILYIKGENADLEQIYYKDVDFLRDTDKNALIDTAKGMVTSEMILILVLFGILGIVFIAVIVLVFKFFPILFLGLIGLLSAKIFNKKLSFANSLKIMMYGNTLPLIIGTIIWLIFKQDISWILSFFLISIYTGYFISQLNTDEDQKDTTLPYNTPEGSVINTQQPIQDLNPIRPQTETTNNTSQS